MEWRKWKSGKMKISAENTERILKGKDPIQGFRCRVLRWHRWTSWGVIEADWERGVIQQKLRCHCVDCGMVRYEDPYSKTIK